VISIRDAVKAVLASDAHMCVESEGSLYVKSLEGAHYITGERGLFDKIEWETDHGADLDAAVDRFLDLRALRNHGKAGW